METDRTQRYERWKTAAKWAAIAVVWIILASITPDLPLLTFKSEHPQARHLVFVLLMGTFGYASEWYAQWRETPEAIGPDDLDTIDSEK